MYIYLIFLYLFQVILINALKNQNNNFGISNLLNKRYIFYYEGYDYKAFYMVNERLTPEMKEKLLINYEKKGLLDYLERKDISQLSKLCYIEKSGFLQNQITNKYTHNIYSGSLKKEFEEF